MLVFLVLFHLPVHLQSYINLYFHFYYSPDLSKNGFILRHSKVPQCISNLIRKSSEGKTKKSQQNGEKTTKTMIDIGATGREIRVCFGSLIRYRSVPAFSLFLVVNVPLNNILSHRPILRTTTTICIREAKAEEKNYTIYTNLRICYTLTTSTIDSGARV